MKEKYLFIIKSHKDESKIESIKVLEYKDCGICYWLKLKNGFDSISKNKVISIKKIIL